MSRKKGKNGKGIARVVAGNKAKAPQNDKAAEPKVSEVEFEALRKPIEAAKDKLDKAQIEAKTLTEKAYSLVVAAKESYRTALAPYRGACRKAGTECEYEGGRSANVSEKVSFLVEKTDKGVRVMVKDKPKTEEFIPLAILKESINRAAYTYTDKHVGPKEEVGNKGGSLSNRIRTVLQ